MPSKRRVAEYLVAQGGSFVCLDCLIAGLSDELSAPQVAAAFEAFKLNNDPVVSFDEPQECRCCGDSLPVLYIEAPQRHSHAADGSAGDE